MSDLVDSTGKVVEFDPKNVYTKFHVNWTYGVGVMNFKVKNSFSLIYCAPIRLIGVKLLGQHLHTTSTQGAEISCLYLSPSYGNLRKHF